MGGQGGRERDQDPRFETVVDSPAKRPVRIASRRGVRVEPAGQVAAGEQDLGRDLRRHHAAGHVRRRRLAGLGEQPLGLVEVAVGERPRAAGSRAC